MKNITITPHAIISLLLCTTLLINTSAPALAQIKLTKTQQEYLSRQAHEAALRDTQMVSDHDSQLNNQINFYKLTDKLSKGNLTQAQLTRLAQIKMMFSPAKQGAGAPSDFEKFQTLYNTQVENEFTREQKAMKDSRALMDEKIKQTNANYHKDIYTALTTNSISEQILKAQGITDKAQQKQLLEPISKDLKQLPYDSDLHTQITALAQKENDPQLARLLTDVAAATQLREQALTQWKEQADSQLREWYKENTTLLSNWKKQTQAKAQQVFDKEYEPQLLKERELAVQQAVRDLWAYKDLAPMAAKDFLTLAPSILQLRTLDGKSFLSKEQKDWLYKQYMHDLQAGRSCKENSNGENSCATALFAITGLSMLTDDRATATAIEEFMQSKIETAYSVPALLTGTAALLSMKQYGVLNGFLHTATQAESNLENFDLLSFETFVNIAANKNGHYLGEVSKYAQYPLHDNPTSQTAVANAWEDVAQLLAEDGSAEALALLRKYGVEQCYASTSKTITLKEEQKLVCIGIIPFLAGALVSGKSGAEHYNPEGIQTHSGAYLTSRGTSIYVSPQQAQQNAREQQASIQEFHHYAEAMGLCKAGMLARHLFLQSMGDLNAESELRLDTQLYKAYRASHPKPKPGFDITAYTRNSPTYNAKRVSQERIQIFRKMAHWADIAFLVWCVYDIGKLVRNGVKISRALIKASSMARNGATVGQRAMMLRRLNVAPQLRTVTSLGSKIKGNISPVVLSQAPLFTSSAVELPKIEGFVPTAGKLVAQNMRFSAETGVLTADVPTLTQASHGAYSAQQTNAFNGLLKTASQNANEQFANRSAIKRFFTFNKDASYRASLANNLLQLKPVGGLRTADLHDLAFQITRSAIRVPQNIASFKVPSFLETAGGTTQLNMGALTRMMTRVFGTTPTTQQVARTEELLNSALVNANAEFLNRGWFSRHWNMLRGTDNQTYRNLLADNIVAQFDKDGTIFNSEKYYQFHQEIVKWVLADQSLTAPAWATRFKFFNTVSHGGKFHTMGTTLLNQAGTTPTELPLVIQMQLARPFRGGIEGVNHSYQRVVLSENKGNLLFGFGNDLSAPVNPSQFKLTLKSADMPALLRAAQNYAGKPLEIKLTSPSNSGSFFSKRLTALKQAYQDGHWNPIPTLFRGKDNIYVHSIPVSIRQADGSLVKLPLTFKADSYLGLRGATAVLEEGNTLSWYRGRNLLRAPALTFGLPKNQLRPFVEILKQAQLKQPLRLKAVSGTNKITPLLWATGLSLSSASTGLIAPLENVYGDRITEMDKTWISLAFPYVPSLAAPFFSPLVMKIGALRTLQLALGVSTAGLGFAAMNGFKGKIDKDNPPPVWPLFVSGISIGVSSALSRSGLNLLIDSMGGGGTLLKSMAYKNIGSFALLLPPFVANFIDKDIDFSLAFPVLGALSAGALTWVSTSRISTAIGKVDGFMPFEPLKLSRPHLWAPTLGKNTWTALQATGKEAWSTTRLLATKQVFPLVLAATAFTGFEAGAFSKAGNQMIRPVVKSGEMPAWIPEANRNNYTAMLTNLSVISFPLITRLMAKPVLKLMENGRAGDEYRRMLQASFALNTAGVSLLYANGFQGFNSLGFLGIGLMGIGTANMTQSFQKLSNISVKTSSYARTLTRGLSGAAKESMEKSLVTKTMTGFPVQQLGIAIVPTLVGGYTDRQIAEGTLEKKNAPLSSLWIPIVSLGLCFGLSMPHIGLFPTHLPAGSFGLTKGLVGSYPGAFKQLPKLDFYMKRPYFGTPDGFTPFLHNPVLNVKDILPSQMDLKKIEKDLENQAKPISQPAEEPAQPAETDGTPTAPQPHTV